MVQARHPARTSTILARMTSPPPTTGLLSARIAAQHGAFSRKDVIELGRSDRELRDWLRSGNVCRAGRGAFFLLPTGMTGIALAEETLRRRARALLLVLPDQLVASHSTALLIHHLPLLQAPRAADPVHLMMTTERTWHARANLRLHRPVVGTRVRSEAGWRYVSPADAVAQHACDQGLEAGVVAGDAALHRTLMTRAELERACAIRRGRAGAGVLPSLVALVDARSESPGESWTRLICLAAGIDTVPQVEIRDGRGLLVARVDLKVRGQLAVLEFDGMVKYRGAANAEALVAEKRREHRLRLLGYIVIRVTWEDFTDPGALIARIRRELALAARDRAC